MKTEFTYSQSQRSAATAILELEGDATTVDQTLKSDIIRLANRVQGTPDDMPFAGTKAQIITSVLHNARVIRDVTNGESKEVYRSHQRMDYVRTVARSVLRTKTQLDEFVVGFQKNPLHAMGWADDTAVAAATFDNELRIHALIVRVESNDEDLFAALDAYTDELENAIIRNAGWGTQRSSSSSRNMTDEARQIAAARAFKDLSQAGFGSRPRYI